MDTPVLFLLLQCCNSSEERWQSGDGLSHRLTFPGLRRLLNLTRAWTHCANTESQDWEIVEHCNSNSTVWYRTARRMQQGGVRVWLLHSVRMWECRVGEIYWVQRLTERFTKAVREGGIPTPWSVIPFVWHSLVYICTLRHYLKYETLCSCNDTYFIKYSKYFKPAYLSIYKYGGGGGARIAPLLSILGLGGVRD